MKFSKWLYRAIIQQIPQLWLKIRLISLLPRDSFPASSKNGSGKTKNIWSAGIVSGFLFLCVSIIPVVAHAGILSFFFGNTVEAAGTSLSGSDSSAVGTLPIPAANSNPNPTSGDLLAVNDGALVAASGVSGTASDIKSNQTTSISLYVVREGDSLSGIAKMFGVSVNTIIWANEITGPINPGDKLVILPITGVEYTVKKGDTVESIAKKFGSDFGDVSSFNGVTDSTLSVGSIIIIPDGEMQSTESTLLQQGKITSGNLPPEPLHGANGPDFDSYYTTPLKIATACLSQGLHGYNAVDIAAPTYTPIYAVAAGTVILAKYNNLWNGGYGNYVVISHANGTQTLYAHMKKVIAKSGEEVSQGDEIGMVGMTGEATGPHLHIEVRGAHNPFLTEYPSCY